jgi:hypothetical protein
MTMRALIHFFPFERGGRRTPIACDGYTAPARFDGDPDGENGYWSLCLRNVRPIREMEWVEADVEFLVADGAPVEYLKAGHHFTIREGRREVARGVFVDRYARVPSELRELELSLHS